MVAPACPSFKMKGLDGLISSMASVPTNEVGQDHNEH